MRHSRLLTLALLAAAGCVETTADDAVDDPAPSTAAPQEHPRAREILAERGPALGSGGDVRETETTISDNGVEHVHYQQTVDGIPVRYGQAIVHGDSPDITDALVPDVAVDTVPALTAEQAIAIVGGEPLAPPSLLVVRLDDRDHLVWQVVLLGEEVLVDAHDGAIVERASAVKEIATTGSSTHDGTVSFETHLAGGRYYLEDTGRRLVTLDARNDNTVSLTTTNDIIDDGDNVWNHPRALQVHAAMKTVFDYFTTKHKRANGDPWRGMNGTGGPQVATGASGLTMIPGVINFVHATKGANYAANSNGSIMLFGNGNGTTRGFYGALDVVAHEYGHGVSNFASDPNRTLESDSLDEHYSDVFGAAVEIWKGYSIYHAYRLGEDVMTPGDDETGTHWDPDKWDAFRYMWQPSLDGVSPDTWHSGIAGLEDEHAGAGPGNLAYYLVAEGGYRNGITVTGSTNDTATRIWFNALRDYLTSTSGYHSLRIGTLRAAADMYGAGSTIYRRVWDAWRAVGVKAEDCPGYDHAEWRTASAYQNVDVPQNGAVLSDDGRVTALVHDVNGKNLDLRAFKYDWNIPGWVGVNSTIGVTPTDWLSTATYQPTWFTWVATNTTSSSMSFLFCHSD